MSFFTATARSPQPRAVSHGGLGGFVQVEELNYDHERGVKSTWPKRRSQRPPSIDIRNGGFAVADMYSASVPLDGIRTPLTPRTLWSTTTTSPAVREMTPGKASPPTSRYNTAGRSFVYTSLPATPSTPNQKFAAEPVELPGSLLLPSQGFPQSLPPITPPRKAIKRRSSEESSSSSSTLCSTPGLSTTSSSSSGEMEVLKTFSPIHKGQKATPTSTMSTISVNKIGKPFSTMTAEELVQCLPDCSPAVISNMWVPAMIREHQKIKALLQETVKTGSDANANLSTFGTDLDSLVNDARKIATGYDNALSRAESISERDPVTCHQKLERAEAYLSEAYAAFDAQTIKLDERKEMIKALNHTSDAVVRTLGAFVEDTLPYSSLDHDRVHEVMQILADYKPSTPHARSQDSEGPSYLRIPEESFQAHLQNLRNIQAQVERFRELAKNQDQVIRTQSTTLDHRVSQYEKCVQTINERDHEVLLLVQEINAQKAIIDDYKSGKNTSEATKNEQKHLTKEMEDMQWTIQSLKMGHAKQLGDRDAEIANLRRKLGNAWEEVLARKKDVKHVISQTQALLAPPEISELGSNSHTGKERKLLGVTLSKRNNMPASKSMLSLGIGEASFGTDIPAGPRSAVETITAYNKPRSHMEPRSPRTDDQPWGCGMTRKRSVPELRRREEQLADLRPRPRLDSLSVNSRPRRFNDLELLQTIAKGSVDDDSTGNSIHTDKALPTPPDVHSEYGSIHNSDGGHSVTEDVLQDLLLPDVPDHNFGSPLSPPRNKRILSGIPELSAEDVESEQGSVSVTSSDKEVYKKSMEALTLIEIMRESDMRTPQKCTFEPDYEGNEYGSMEENPRAVSEKEESPPKTVTQMYHGSMRKK